MKTIAGLFVSAPRDGLIYVAERSRKGSRKLIWSVMPEKHGADIRCEPRKVPLAIRRQAYHHLNGG